VMKAVIVFCEGNHDVVFVTRSLGAVAQAEWVGDPIRELPSPFGPVPDPQNPKSPKVRSLIAQRYSARTLDDMHMRAAAHPPHPSFEALLRVNSTNTFFALVRCHGDGASQATISLLDDFRALMLPGMNVDVGEIAAAFLFDADDAGVASRQATFASQHTGILDGSSPHHAQWVVGKHFPVGLYVFHDGATQTGTLEDTLAPLVEAQWAVRWQNAGAYLTSYADQSDPVATKASERLKAQFCITGQFRCPGDPMTETLRRNGLPRSAFLGTVSQALVTFLTGVPW